MDKNVKNKYTFKYIYFGGFKMKDMLWIDNDFESEDTLEEMVKSSSIEQQIKLALNTLNSSILSRMSVITVPFITKLKGVSYRVDVSFSLIKAEVLLLEFNDIDINSFDDYYSGDFETIEDLVSKNVYGILKFTEETDFKTLLIG